MPVAPFGRPIECRALGQVPRTHRHCRLIDAAAAFEFAEARAGAFVVSLHATKVLGIGEGGCIASRDEELIRDLRARCNLVSSVARIRG